MEELNIVSRALTRAARALAASAAGAAATLATEVAIALTRATKATENCMFARVNEMLEVENMSADEIFGCRLVNSEAQYAVYMVFQSEESEADI